VLLDRDLAELYGVSTKVLNQAVKRNARRFPPDFMFRLTKKEKDEKIQAIFEAIQQLISLPENSQKKIGFNAKETEKSYRKKPTTKKESTRKNTKK